MRVARLERMASIAGWRYCATCIVIRKPAPGGLPQDPIERLWRLDCEPGAPCRPRESLATTLSVNDATLYRRGKIRQASPSQCNPPSPAETPTPGPPRPRPTLKDMGEALLSNARVFRDIPASCLEAYRRLMKFYLRRCVGLARVHGANSPQVTNAVQDKDLLTFSVRQSR